MSLDPTGQLLHKATLPSLRDIAALPNIQKQTQGGSQNEETKNHVTNTRKKNSKKRTKQMEISNLPDAEFKTLVIGCSMNQGEK